MTDVQTLDGYLGPNFQLQCLWQLITEPEFAEKTIPLLEISYFDDPTYKRFFNIIRQYFSTYGMPPNLQSKSILTGIRKFVKASDTTEIELLDAVAVQIKNWNERVLNKDIPNDGEMIQRETVSFIKQQEYRKMATFVLNGVKEGNNSDHFLYEVDDMVKKIGDIGDDEDMGIEIMENVSRALQKEFRKAVPTGIEGIDTLTKGGLGGGEMGIILAGTGIGKSTILTYIANTAYNHGLNALQIIFEDKEDDIRRKHYAKWSGIPLSEIDDRRDEVHQKIVDWHKNNTYGRLIIKKFSQEDTTMPKIRQYVEKYRKKHGVKFDIIVLDYIDVLEGHKRSVDQNATELQIIKSFEGMADELNIPCWTAIQANRTGYDSEVLQTSQMSGNIKRAQKTHFLMSIAKTADQKLDGQANIAILKARMAQDGHIFRDCIFNNNTMEIRITDDILPASTRAMLATQTITPEKLETFNAIISATKENEEPEEYVKPDDTIEIDSEVILNKIHTNADITNGEKNDINKKLDQMASGQDVMKK